MGGGRKEEYKEEVGNCWKGGFRKGGKVALGKRENV